MASIALSVKYLLEEFRTVLGCQKAAVIIRTHSAPPILSIIPFHLGSAICFVIEVFGGHYRR